MQRADKVKRAVCKLVFGGLDDNHSLFVPRNYEKASPLDELEMEVQSLGEELVRVVRVKMNGRTRYFEVRVKELM